MTSRATNSGPFTLLVTDGSSTGIGSGNYRLDVEGLYAGVKLCLPLRSAGNLNFNGAGGPPGLDYIVTTSTNVLAPRELWTPVLTNQFGAYGEVNFTQPYDPSVIEQFFRLLLR